MHTSADSADGEDDNLITLCPEHAVQVANLCDNIPHVIPTRRNSSCSVRKPPALSPTAATRVRSAVRCSRDECGSGIVVLGLLALRGKVLLQLAPSRMLVPTRSLAMR